MTERFSRRHRPSENQIEITVRHDAPSGLRQAVVAIAYELNITPTPLRKIVCSTLRMAPDPENWTEFPNVDWEVRHILDTCAWFHVYDVIEQIYQAVAYERVNLSHGKLVVRNHLAVAESFANEINQYFREYGIGWQLTEGHIEVRGPESLEEPVRKTQEVLKSTDRSTAADQFNEARIDLSRRPDPDITGAIQHAMAGMECVMRDVTGDPRATPGAILKKNPHLLPKPLDDAVAKAWGYSSEMGRHLREGRIPEYAEAEFMVMLSSAVCLYLIEKSSGD